MVRALVRRRRAGGALQFSAVDVTSVRRQSVVGRLSFVVVLFARRKIVGALLPTVTPDETRFDSGLDTSKASKSGARVGISRSRGPRIGRRDTYCWAQSSV